MLNLEYSSRKDIRIYYEGRNYTYKQNNGREYHGAVSVYDEIYFCKIAQTTLTCSVVTLAC